MELLITEENYHTFLTYHGLDIDVARYVVSTYDGTDGYYSLQAVKVWVEASKMVIKLHDRN
jgi:hypothetical protein